MIKIGITGGIGSGKSVISTLLAILSIPVYMADKESKILTDTLPSIKLQLISLFGKNIYTNDRLNKKLLASYIFNDTENLKKVNAIIHPPVNRHFVEWAGRQTGPFCGIETAILFESGFDKSVDTSIMVYAPIELRIKRSILRDKVSRDDIIKRINNQMPDEIKKEQAEYVIYNDENAALIPQVENIISKLKLRL